MVNPCGHIGFGLIFAQLIKSWFRVEGLTFDDVAVDLITIIFSLLPDLVDKPLYWMKLQKSTRSIGHTLLFLFAVTYSFSFFCVQVVNLSGLNYFDLEQVREVCLKEEWKFYIFTAVVSHLLSDLLFGYVPLFWPLQSFRYPSMIHTRKSKSIIAIIEISSLAYVYYFKHRLFAEIGMLLTTI